MGCQNFVYTLLWLLSLQGGGLDVLSERFPPQQATPPLMMEDRPTLYPQPYSSPSPTAGLSGPFQGMVRQKPSLGTMPVQVTPPRGTFSPNMGMQPRQTLNRPPAAPNQLRLQLQQRLQGQQQVSAVLWGSFFPKVCARVLRDSTVTTLKVSTPFPDLIERSKSHPGSARIRVATLSLRDADCSRALKPTA